MLLKGIFLAALFVLEMPLLVTVIRTKIQPVDLHYVSYKMLKDCKNEEKSPIVLIHGVAGSNKQWNSIIPDLAVSTCRKIYAIDLRNHGDSPWIDCTTAECMSVDIVHFLKKHNIRKANLIGHSFGGKIAVHVTLNCPDRVNSLVVEDMRANGVAKEGMLSLQQTFPFYRKAIASVKNGSNEEAAKKQIANYFIDALKEMGVTDEFYEKYANTIEIRRDCHEWQWKMNTDVLEKNVKNVSHQLTFSYGLYNGPCLFIYGSKSIMKVGEDKVNIRKLFPNTKFVAVEGAEHNIHGVFPEFNQEVIALLNSLLY